MTCQHPTSTPVFFLLEARSQIWLTGKPLRSLIAPSGTWVMGQGKRVMLCPSATWNASSAGAQENTWNQVLCAVHKDADAEQQVARKDQREHNLNLLVCQNAFPGWLTDCLPFSFFSALSLSKGLCTYPSQITMYFFHFFSWQFFCSTGTEWHQLFLSRLCFFTVPHFTFKIIAITFFSTLPSQVSFFPHSTQITGPRNPHRIPKKF